MTTTAPADGGMTIDAGVGADAGVIVPPDASPSDGSSPESGLADGGTPLADGGPSEAGAAEGGACAPGTADCDHDPSNGCEATLSGDPKNCNACGHDCTALPNVSGSGVTCNSGVCDVPASACTSGYGHCSSNPNDGCEANLGTAQTCGSCSNSCSGSTPDCSGGGCTDGCSPATLTSCSGSCVDTTSSGANCGSCGHACPVPQNGSASCSMSTCTSSCNGGFHSCDNGVTCSDNTQPATCGSSCTPCPAPSGGIATCTTGGACGFACAAGSHSCDNGVSCSSDGSTATCGSSCTPCPLSAGAVSTTCSGDSATATCGVVCDGTHHTCDSGATCSDNNSTATCGASCTPCAAADNAATTCNGTACVYACDSGYANCSGTATNNCDTNLSDDAGNCGACGHSCRGGTCSAGVCQPFVLASSVTPSAITLDTQNVYFTNNNTNVSSVPKAGGAFVTTQTWPVSETIFGSLVVTGTELYALNTGAGGLEQIATAGISGGGFYILAQDANTVANGDPYGSRVVVSNQHLFWSDKNHGSIQEVAGSSVVQTPAQVYSIGNGNNYYLDELAAAPDGYLAWEENAYSVAASTIYGAMPTCASGCTLPAIPTLIAHLSTTPTTLFADGSYVYFIAAGSLTTVARSGGSPVHTVSVGTGNPASLVVGASTTAYWVSNNDEIESVPIAGGTVRVVATGSDIQNLVVDSTAIYWTTANTIMELVE